MTKLEEKLLELGYKHSYNGKVGVYYGKWYDNHQTYKMLITLDYDREEILNWYVYPYITAFNEQDHIDDLQQAYNQLQKDLEVMKEYENS